MRPNNPNILQFLIWTSASLCIITGTNDLFIKVVQFMSPINTWCLDQVENVSKVDRNWKIFSNPEQFPTQKLFYWYFTFVKKKCDAWVTLQAHDPFSVILLLLWGYLTSLQPFYCYFIAVLGLKFLVLYHIKKSRNNFRNQDWTLGYYFISCEVLAWILPICRV